MTDTGQIVKNTSTAAENISVNLGPRRQAVDIAVDVSGSATLTISVSHSGKFNGEEYKVQEISYSSSSVNLEQFSFAHKFIEVSVNQNLNSLEIVTRGD